MRRWGARALGAAAILLALGASGMMCQRVSARGRYATPYSTFGAGPNGARALMEITERAGFRAERWVEDLARLPARGVLVALGGCLAPQLRPVSGYEREVLDAWLRAGGTLMVFGAEEYLDDDAPVRLARLPDQCGRFELPEALQELTERDESAEVGDETEDGESRPPEPVRETLPHELPRAFRASRDWEDDLPPEVFGASLIDGPLTPLRVLHMQRPAYVEIDRDVAPEVMALIDDEPVAARVDVGEGHLVVFGSASMLINERISLDRGGVAFVRLLRDIAPPGTPVFFDEYHLGVGGTRSIVRYLRQVGGAAVLLQLLVLAVIWVARHGRRFGELERAPDAPPGGTVSYVAATAALYSRSNDRAEVARTIVGRALRRVATHHRVTPTEPSELARELGELRRVVARDAVLELGELLAREIANERDLRTLLSVVDEAMERALVVARHSATSEGSS